MNVTADEVQTGHSQSALKSVYQVDNFWSCTWYVLLIITLFHHDLLIECNSRGGKIMEVSVDAGVKIMEYPLSSSDAFM